MMNKIIFFVGVFISINSLAQYKDFPETNGNFLTCNGRIPFSVSFNKFGGAILILKGTEYNLFSSGERYVDNEANRYVHYSGLNADIFIQTWLPNVNKTIVSNSSRGVLNKLSEGTCY